MMKAVFEFPQAAYFGRNLPKNKIYEHAPINSKTKTEFVSKIENILYSYELSQKSVNLSATESVPKIEVLQINLRDRDLSFDALRAIDKAIPRPLIFELSYDGEIRQIAAFKRPSDAGGDNWVIGEYYASDWQDINAPRTKLPNALDLGGLYAQMLQNYIGEKPRQFEGMTDFVTRLGYIAQIRRDIERLSANAQKQKQANRQIEINAQIRALNIRLQELN